MKLIVIIATFGRPALLGQKLRRLEQQTRLPDEVIVSAPDATHAPASLLTDFPISYIFGKQGLCAQRNQALEVALQRSDIITFFDDDFLPASNYLELIETKFLEHADWSVITGTVVKDGINGPGLSFEEGQNMLRSDRRSRRQTEQVEELRSAYGCNMSIRSRSIGAVRFDERLLLYGWQEDVDFTSQIGRMGKVVRLSNLLGVHLGAKTGRVSGVRFGYSQIINPAYLTMKGTMPIGSALQLMARNVLANTAKCLWPEPYIDRWGRLRGNLLALGHVIVGKIEPEYILQI